MKCRYFCRLPLDISPVYLTRGISISLFLFFFFQVLALKIHFTEINIQIFINPCFDRISKGILSGITGIMILLRKCFHFPMLFRLSRNLPLFPLHRLRYKEYTNSLLFLECPLLSRFRHGYSGSILLIHQM